MTIPSSRQEQDTEPIKLTKQKIGLNDNELNSSNTYTDPESAAEPIYFQNGFRFFPSANEPHLFPTKLTKRSVLKTYPIKIQKQYEMQSQLFGIDLLKYAIMDENYKYKRSQDEYDDIFKDKDKKSVDDEDDEEYKPVCLEELIITEDVEEVNVYVNAITEFFDSLVISQDATWKKIFDIIIIFSSVYLVISNAFYASFRPPTDDYEFWLDISMIGLFFFDMVFNFFQEFFDPETYQVVSSCSKIAINYIKTSFFLDFIAWVPYDYLFFRDKMYKN